MNAIATPATGLMIFNTDLNCIHYYFGAWKSQCDPANLGAWGLLGNTGTNAATNFVGTTDNVGLSFRTNNILRQYINPTTGGISTGNYLTTNQEVYLGNGVDIKARQGFRQYDNFNTARDYNDGTNALENIGTSSSIIIDVPAGSTHTYSKAAVASAIVPATSTASIASIVGSNSRAYNFGSGNTGYIYGAINTIRNSGSSPITGALSVTSMNLVSAGTGTIANAYGANIDIGNSNTAVITNAFGSRIRVKNTGAGSITNGYGLYLDDVDGTNNWGIYQQTATNKNYFAGNTGIGITTPGYKLDINSASNPLRMSGLQVGSTADSVLTVSSAVVKRMRFSDMVAGTAWALDGNNVTAVKNLGTTSNFDLPFITNNTEKMRILANGNVGISNATPLALLDFGNVLTNRKIYLHSSATDPYGFGMASNELRIFSGSMAPQNGATFGSFDGTTFTGTVKIENRGFVGIGNTAPAYKLDITSTTNPVRMTGLQTGATTDDVMTVDAAGVLKKQTATSFVTNNAWGLTGNTGTTAGTNFIGTTDAKDVVIKANGVEGLRLKNADNSTDIAGHLAVGGNATPNTINVVKIAETQGDYTASNYSGINTNITINPTSTYSNSTSGSDSYVSIASGNTQNMTSYISGASNNAYHNGTGLISNLSGSVNGAVNNSNGTLGLARALVARTNNTSTGTMTTAVGGDFTVYSTGSGSIGSGYGVLSGGYFSAGTTNNFYGLYANNPTMAGGVINNNYGVFIANQTAGTTSNYALYAAGGQSYHAGNFGLGISTPAYKLDINSVSNPLRMSGLQVGSTADSILTVSSAVVKRMKFSDMIGASAWGLLGNTGTVDGTNFIGTTDNIPFNIRVNGQKAGRIENTNANSFWGYQSGLSNTTGRHNTFNGYKAGYSTTIGEKNTAYGSEALYSNIGNYHNTAIGYRAMYSNVASDNTAVGENALYSNTTGHASSAVGLDALYSNTTGDENTAIGYYSLRANTTGYFNVANGVNALLSNTTGSQNTALGKCALRLNTTGNNNVATGFQALRENTSGNNNVATGINSLYYNTTGEENQAFGYQTLYYNTVGSSNVAIGREALYSNTTGMGNVAIGNYAGYDMNITNSFSGNNTFIGTSAGRGITTGANNTIVGANVTLVTPTISNNIILADGSGNQRINVGATGNVGLGITTPGYKLDVNSASNPLRISGLQVGSSVDSVLTVSSAVVKRMKFSDMVAGNAWALDGNNVAAIKNLGTTSNFDLPFITNNTEKMRILAGGNVGIATATPTEKLQVFGGNVEIGAGAGVGSVPNPMLRIHSNANIGGSGGSIEFNESSPDYGIRIRHNTQPDATYAEGLHFETKGLGGVYASIPTLTVQQPNSSVSGNVGISVPLPNTKLDVDGAIALRPAANAVTADNQAITVGNRSFLRLTPDGTPANRTITLSNGLQDGQQLVIRVSATGANGIELADSGNLNISGTAMLDDGDTLTLIWDGSLWFEMYRSNN
jgi:hypothetical protein